INTAIVGAKNVRIPIEVAGLIYGASHPNIKAEIVPPTGPRSGAVKLERRTLEKVIDAGVPGSGEVIKKTHARSKAVQTLIKAKQ
ncbi:hypothetical protein DRO54_02400, partial [Candidatus Bathyarchaeota archaeon]